MSQATEKRGNNVTRGGEDFAPFMLDGSRIRTDVAGTRHRIKFSHRKTPNYL